MRPSEPILEGFAVRDDLKLGYEVFGAGNPTILLMPTWTIIHSRFWKFQVPYLSRYYRVVTYDGPGNGRSDRTVDPQRYSASAYAADAVAVLQECGIDEAVVVGLSLGAAYGLALASEYPEFVSALVFIGPSLAVEPPPPERSGIAKDFLKPYPKDVQGWGKYNVQYWHDHYQDFTEFFFSECFSEPHSTKAIDDSVRWAQEAGPDILEAESSKRPMNFEDTTSMLTRLTCPLLVVHGTEDRISTFETGVEATRLGGGRLASLEGSGHLPNVRDPIPFNFLLRDFVDGLKR